MCQGSNATFDDWPYDSHCEEEPVIVSKEFLQVNEIHFIVDCLFKRYFSTKSRNSLQINHSTAKLVNFKFLALKTQ